MDKFVQILSKQKEYFSVECQNPKCGKTSDVKTIEFFSVDTYSFICPYCNNRTSIEGVDKQLDKLKKQFKDMGIKW